MGFVGSLVYAGVAGVIETVKDIFSGSSSSGYSPRASKTAAHAKSNADMLAELKAETRSATEKKEKKILEYINESMDKLLETLGEINQQDFGGKRLNINVKEMQNKNDDLKKEVVGFIGNYMDGRLVLSDPELSKILNESDDKKRKKKFDAFYIQLQGQAVDKLKSKIEITVHKQEEMIRKEIQNRMTEVDKNMQEATTAYEEILRMKEEQEDSMIEEKQIQYCYQYELSAILSGQLES